MRSITKQEPEPSRKPFSQLRHDFPASVVVALVALPLCLGIAIASDAKPMAGLVTGMVGGLLVAWLSGSSLAVSGPAAGLTAVVVETIHTLGYEGFLLAVIIAGALQIGLGFARLGIFGYYIPNAVIRGMLAAIGLILILKQIPHAVGFDKDYEGDLSFVQEHGENTFSYLFSALGQMHMGAVAITTLALALLIVVPKTPVLKDLRWLPAPLLAVLGGILINLFFQVFLPVWAVDGDRLVLLPEVTDLSVFKVASPDFSAWMNPQVYASGAVLAIVASIETLLCVEAVDKLDPFKRITPTNRELKAQGVGNMVAGFLGGIPMTAVIVRGSANVHSGGRTNTSAFLHGLWLLLAVWFAGDILRSIPLASLAGVLLVVGYKLAPVSMFKHMYSLGAPQFLPFIATVVGILVTDLLVGICIGMVVAIFYILKENLSTPYFLHHLDEHPDVEAGGRIVVHMELSENVSFLNKAAVNRALHDIPEGAYVEIDGSRSRHIHHDVLEFIYEFEQSVAPARKIDVRLSSIPEIGSAAMSK